MANTSLAQQLRRLAVPQTSILLADKKRASLLFDPKEASNLDLDTVLEIGLSGLHELENIGGPEFGYFEKDLFDITSVGIERAVLTKGDNEVLNERIQKFLAILGPYAILKPAYKTLEWLIRRFHIHEYNQNELIFLFLPYHESKIFVRVLQLIDISSPSHQWYWLNPLRQAGTSLPLSTIVGHASSSNSFLISLCEHVLFSIKVHKAKASVLSNLFAFYCTTVVGAIERIQRKRKGTIQSAREAQLQVILPCLMKGLPSVIPDFACASFMIVSSLARNGYMAHNLLHKIVNKIVKNCNSETFQLKEVAALFAVLCETQGSTKLSIFPATALKKMLESNILIPLIRESVSMSSVAFVGSFMMALIVGLLPLAKESVNGNLALLSRKAMDELISTVLLEKKYSREAIRLFASALADVVEEEKSEDFGDHLYSSWLNGLIKGMETKYPADFDSFIKQLVLVKDNENSKMASIFGRLLGISLLDKEEFGSLIEKLCHPEAGVRIIALQKLSEMDLAALKSEEDKQTLIWVLEQRLHDDCAIVIKDTLSLPFLDSILGKDKVIAQGINIVERASQNMGHSSESKKWQEVTLAAIRALFSHGIEIKGSLEEVNSLLKQRFKVLFTVIPFLCPTTEDELKLAQEILKLPLSDPMLNSLSNEISDEDNDESFCCAVFNHLLNFESFIAGGKMEIMDLVETLCSQCMQDTENTLGQLIIILILSAIANNSSIRIKSRILDLGIQVLNQSKVAVTRDLGHKPIAHVISPKTWASCITTARKGYLPIQAVLHCFTSVFHSSSESSWFSSSPSQLVAWWSHNGLVNGAPAVEDQHTTLAVQIFDALIFGCFLRKGKKSLPEDVANTQMLYVGCLKDFFDAHLPQLPHQLNFLSCLWVAHEVPLSRTEGQKDVAVSVEKLTIHSKTKDYIYYHSVTRSGFCISPELQIRSLRLAEALISRSSVPISWLLESDGIGTAIVPSILVACTSRVTCVRAATISLLRSLVCTVGANLPHKGSLYTPLVKELVGQSEEILLDPGQLLLALYAQLSPEPDILAMHSMEKRQEMTKIRDSIFSILTPDSLAPCYIKRALLQMLYGVRSVDLLKHLSQLGMTLLDEGQHISAMDEYSTDCFAAIISRFDSNIAPFLSDSKKGSSALWTLFKNSLSDTVTELPSTEDVKQFQFPTNDFLKVTCPAILCLQQVTREFYDALPSQNIRQEILSIMIDVASQSNTRTLPSTVKEFPLAEAASLAAKNVIKKLSIDANLIVEEMEKMLTFDEDAGKRRASLRKPMKKVLSVLTPKDLQSQSWMRGVVLLEIMQTKKKIKNPQLILPLLFELLKLCLQLQHQEPVEYTKQLILACALHCLRKMDDSEEDEDDNEHDEKKIDKSQLDVETIVHCIRSTQNPHTHRHALLLLSRAAELVPDSVLHNVMAIFAFVGTSMVRQDDEYSFEVIARTIESVVPVLTKVDPTKSIPRKKASEGWLEFLEGRGAAGVLKVTRVFADAVPDVPPHRRLPLYVKLVETVGWNIGLPQLLLLVIEGHVLHAHTKSLEKDASKTYLDSRIELAHEIAREAPPYFIILTMLRMVEFVNLLPADKESGANGKILWHTRQTTQSKQLSHNFSHIFDVKIHTGTQLRHFKHAVLSFLLEIISEPQIVAKVSLVDEIDRKNVEDQQGVDKLFQDLIQVLLSYIATIAGELDVAGGSNSSGRYWKAMQQRCHQILEKVNNLLPGSLFLTVVRGLLGYQLPSVRRKAADILSNRLLALLSEKGTPSDACASFSEEDLSSLQGILLGPLVNLMHSRDKSQIDSAATKENDLNCQVSLFTVKLLVRIVGPVEKPDVLKEVLSHVTSVASGALAVESGMAPTSSSVLASAVLCIAEICTVMKVNVLTELNNFMPVLLSALSSNMKDSVNNTAQIGVVTAVQRVVESIPNFISPYLKTFLVRLCLFTTQQTASEESECALPTKNDQLSLRLTSILNKVASAIPLRVLIPAVSETYIVLTEGKLPPQSPTPSKDGKKRKRLKSTSEEETMIPVGSLEVLPNKSKCHTAIIPLMDMFSHSLSEMTRVELNNHISDLESFFLSALDFRVKNRSVESSEVVERVEASLISTLIVLVMKLSEAMFRSLYYRLFEWASGDKAPLHRAITFYRFSSRCAEALKGLFVLFAGHCIRHAAILLDRNNLAKVGAEDKKQILSLKEADEEENPAEPKDNTLYFGDEDSDGIEAHMLIKCILTTLNAVFLYEDGTGRFVTSGRFETLMPPLVNQLENLVGGMDRFEERCSANVIPTLVKFAVSAADDSLWKQLNYQILLKTRHNNPKVRLAGLSALLELGKQLGEDFLPLLPETVPFLAELLEDEEEEVEMAAQKAIAALSDVLGEPLQKYL
ncbi:HEAT repeat-containing protein 1 [Hetaerina americana]|uniref:HEAT repeat-containing protein 1 n=1 Tax=Hetaerina americana TaxID=62018 RepID=UPI003A7F150C